MLFDLLPPYLDLVLIEGEKPEMLSFPDCIFYKTINRLGPIGPLYGDIKPFIGATTLRTDVFTV